ncbi:MAG: hypothetical protein SOV58_02185 [Candidatus Enteromonas sp.]|nr:hypothetical protein [Candidatus Enteromonas sp.]
MKMRNFFRRHAVFFSVLGASALASVIALMSVKGIVTNVDSLAPTYSYGQTPQSFASSIFGDAELEYSKADEDVWSKIVPTTVGKYKMRAVGKNGFGGTYYSEVQYFEITPIEATVEFPTKTWQYGETPSIEAKGLIPGDRCTSYEIVYDSYEDLTPKATITNVRFSNSQGIDVTENYSVQALPVDITWTARPLIVSGTDYSGVYNGKEHTSEGYEINPNTSLAEGDKIQVAYNKTVIEETGSISSVKVFHGKTDVTALYNLTIHPGTIHVDPLSASIASPDYSKVYDGKSVEKEKLENYEIVGVLKEDESNIEITPSHEEEIIEVGTYPNDFTYNFPLNADNRYVVQTTKGSISVTKRPLAIDIKPQYQYNGDFFQQRLAETDFSVTNPATEENPDQGLAEGHVLQVEVDIESVLNGFNQIAQKPIFTVNVLNGSGEDVTSNYAITTNQDSARYSQAECFVTSPEKTVVYDGNSHGFDIAIEGLLGNDKVILQDKQEPSNTYLFGNIAEATELSSLVRFVEAGQWNFAKYYQIKMIGTETETGMEDRSIYYRSVLDTEVFEIRKRPLIIDLTKAVWIYEGTRFSGHLTPEQYEIMNPASEEKPNQGLLEGHSLDIEVQNIYSDPQFTASVSYVTEEGEKVYVTSNYEIQLQNETLAKFSQAKLIQNLNGDAEVIYDGKKHGFTHAIDGLQGGDEVVYAEGKSPEELVYTKPGTYEIQPQIASILCSTDEDETKKDRTEYYEFEPISKTLTIQKRRLKVRYVWSGSYSGSYWSGETLSLGVNFFAEGYEDDLFHTGLAEGDVITATMAASPDPYLQSSKPKIDLTIENSDGIDVSSCYEIAEDSTEITVNKAGPLTVSYDTTATYDGTEKRCTITVSGVHSNDTVEFAPLVDNMAARNGFSSNPSPGEFKFSFDVATDWKSSGYEIAPRFQITHLGADGTPVSANGYYPSSIVVNGETTTATVASDFISLDHFTFKIAKRNVDVTLYTYGSEENHFSNPTIFAADGLASTDAVLTSSKKNAEGMIEYDFAIVRKSDNKTVVNDNYVIHSNKPIVDAPIALQMSILDEDEGKRNVNVDEAKNSRSYTVTYDGRKHGPTGVDVSGVPVGCDAEVHFKDESTPSINQQIVPGTYTYRAAVDQITSESAQNSDVTHYFSYSEPTLTFTIEKKKVEIDIHGNRKYDGSLFSETALSSDEYSLNTPLPDPDAGSLSITPIDSTIFEEGVEPRYRVRIWNTELRAWVFDEEVSCDGSTYTSSCYELTFTGGIEFQKAAGSLTYTGPTEKEYDGDTSLPDKHWGLSTENGTPNKVEYEYLDGNGDVMKEFPVTPSEEAYQYSVKVVTIVDGSGEDRTKYYDVEPSSGSMKINKRQSTLIISTVHDLFIGVDSSILDAVIHVDVSNLPAGYKYNDRDLAFKDMPTVPGVYEFKDYYLGGLKIANANNKDVTAFFDIAVEGTFVVHDLPTFDINFQAGSFVFTGSSNQYNLKDLGFTFSSSDTSYSYTITLKGTVEILQQGENTYSVENYELTIRREDGKPVPVNLGGNVTVNGISVFASGIVEDTIPLPNLTLPLEDQEVSWKMSPITKKFGKGAGEITVKLTPKNTSLTFTEPGSFPITQDLYNVEITGKMKDFYHITILPGEAKVLDYR